MDDKQQKTPFYTKLKEYSEKHVIPFDVPGHKRGMMDNDLKDDLGVKVFEYDSNSPRGLDNLNKPKSVIKDSEELAALAFGADKAYFLTGGTTTGILAMIMLAVRAKEKIIMPRNVHKSVINGLIVSGGIPVFVKPDMDKNLGIANGVSFENYKKAIDENKDAKAIFIINPTYFGVTNDFKRIIHYAHKNGMMVIADEAHGGNLYFSDELPLSAMAANADVSAVSSHKTLGSFTQSSILLTKGSRVDQSRLRATLNIVQSTSPNQLLIASIDTARKNMYFEGKRRLSDTIKMADKAIKEINTIKGIKSYGKNYFIDNGAFDYDRTKLIIDVSELGITGFDAYKILADKYSIQMELAEIKIILAILSIGTTEEHLKKLTDALKDMSLNYYGKAPKIESKFIYTYPESYTRPREAYHAPHKVVPIEDSLGEIASEMIMAYPPGIPIVIPGEIITEEIIEAIEEYENSDSTVLSDYKDGYVKVIDKDEWIKWEGKDDEV